MCIRDRAYVAGVNAALHSRLQLVVYNRNFERAYQALYGGALSENTRNQNERGTYFGAVGKITSTLTMQGYVDRYRFDWLTFQTDAPSAGGDVLLQANWRPNRSVEGYVRYRNETKKRNSRTEGQTMQRVDTEDRNWYRIHLDYRVSESIKLKNRVEFSTYKLGDESTQNGILIYQDFQYKKPEGWFSFTGRFAVFDTESFDARIYAYENDVLFFFNVPAYSGRGIRAYALTKFDIGKRTDLWVRVSRTYFTDRDSVGSGLEEIDQPFRTDARVQLRFRF